VRKKKNLRLRKVNEERKEGNVCVKVRKCVIDNMKCYV
jgi:hypothetical protein